MIERVYSSTMTVETIIVLVGNNNPTTSYYKDVGKSLSLVELARQHAFLYIVCVGFLLYSISMCHEGLILIMPTIRTSLKAKLVPTGQTELLASNQADRLIARLIRQTDRQTGRQTQKNSGNFNASGWFWSATLSLYH